MEEALVKSRPVLMSDGGGFHTKDWMRAGAGAGARLRLVISVPKCPGSTLVVWQAWSVLSVPAWFRIYFVLRLGTVETADQNRILLVSILVG